MTQWSISAPGSWWALATKALNSCSEPSKSSTDSLSFLSCAVIDIEDGSARIISQSLSSGLELYVEQGHVVGSGRVLVAIKEFSHALNSLPHDGDITISQDEADGYIDVSSDDGAVSFSVSTHRIISEDMLPQPPVVDDKDVFVGVDLTELSSAYKQGSLMSKANIGSEDTGYDPLSGAIISIDSSGIQILSLAISSSEALVQANLGDKDYHAQCISKPQVTAPQLAIFSQLAGKGEIAIGLTGHILIRAGGSTMSIAPLNTSGSNDVVSYQTIISALSPAWDNRVVTATVPSKEFFQALRRAESVSDDDVRIFVDDTTLTVCGLDSRRQQEYSFTQEITCSTQWHGDVIHDLSYGIEPSVMKKLAGFDILSSEVIFSLALDEDGNYPWAMVVYPSDFDIDNPHNFFLISVSE